MEAPAPEYQTELPSIPMDRSAAPQARSEFREFAPFEAPARVRWAADEMETVLLPSVPIVPIPAGGAALAVAGLVWFFFVRATPPG
jgi:hypothetical protein